MNYIIQPKNNKEIKSYCSANCSGNCALRCSNLGTCFCPLKR